MAAPIATAPPAVSATPPAEDLGLHGPARIAGAGILVLAVLAGFGAFIATRGLVTDGNAALTAQDIAKSEGLFRSGILSLCLVVVLDVVVAAALYRLMRPANETTSPAPARRPLASAR